MFWIEIQKLFIKLFSYSFLEAINCFSLLLVAKNTVIRNHLNIQISSDLIFHLKDVKFIMRI